MRCPVCNLSLSELCRGKARGHDRLERDSFKKNQMCTSCARKKSYSDLGNTAVDAVKTNAKNAGALVSTIGGSLADSLRPPTPEEIARNQKNAEALVAVSSVFLKLIESFYAALFKLDIDPNKTIPYKTAFLICCVPFLSVRKRGMKTVFMVLLLQFPFFFPSVLAAYYIHKDRGIAQKKNQGKVVSNNSVDGPDALEQLANSFEE